MTKKQSTVCLSRVPVRSAMATRFGRATVEFVRILNLGCPITECTRLGAHFNAGIGRGVIRNNLE